MSNDFAPFSACSSPVVKSSSTPAANARSFPPSPATSRRAVVTIVAIAALLSAPRMASWRFGSRPFSLTTSTGPSSGTVSMCAHSSTVGASSDPGIRASTFPEPAPVAPAVSSSSTSRPSARRSAIRASAIARSLPEGLSISQYRTKSPSSRSRSSVDAAWITPRTLPLDRPAAPLPARDAAVGDVAHVLGAQPLQQARADRGALARPADHRNRPVRVQPLGDLADVVVGRVDRARDAALVPLRALTHVEHLEAVRATLAAIVQLLHRHPLHALDR